ncbi:hypothetical protein BS47DRAFT_1418248 [Hydnum rufescens UP504]|uniref:Uncharacterized protein n=1 Tax=Hydnum rufescens UP504 TaxID=1448309 RepID=A0A9P6DRW5_9AGAM|nr:hypothetical protein BS47DRAFT_1418248 [Hydnum rufescens UP504]
MNLVALGVLASYFLVILFLLAFVVLSQWSLYKRIPSSVPQARYRRHVLFFGLTVCSFLHTWYCMCLYAFDGIAFWSFEDYETNHILESREFAPLLERVSDWLTDTALFEQAWLRVCDNASRWWWSEQLCLFTVGPLTVFMYSQSRRLRIPHAWAYMIIGQLVAISVASNLFYAAAISRPLTLSLIPRRNQSPPSHPHRRHP